MGSSDNAGQLPDGFVAVSCGGVRLDRAGIGEAWMCESAKFRPAAFMWSDRFGGAKMPSTWCEALTFWCWASRLRVLHLTNAHLIHPAPIST